MGYKNKCPKCGINTDLDVCPDCSTILEGDNRGKDFHDVEGVKGSAAAPETKKAE